MKKNYLKPQSKVVEIKSVKILCGSAGMSGESQSNTVALGRQGRFSDWDEEE